MSVTLLSENIVGVNKLNLDNITVTIFFALILIDTNCCDTNWWLRNLDQILFETLYNLLKLAKQ